MGVVLIALILLAVYDLSNFIRKKERITVFIAYMFFMLPSILVSLLFTVGKSPVSPAQWIENLLKMVGVVK